MTSDLRPFYDRFAGDETLGPVLRRRRGMRVSTSASRYEFMINPEEVEEVLLELAGVSACRVYSVPSEGMGEVVAADLVGEQLELETIRGHCLRRLDPFKMMVSRQSGRLPCGWWPKARAS